MKKLFLLVLICVNINGYSQITLDCQVPGYLFFFKLDDTESKLLKIEYLNPESTKQFELYNLDGSLFKTIQIPQFPDSRIQIIDWVSSTLFDNDPSTIEYLAYYTMNNSSSAKVIREDGTILLDELYAYLVIGGWDSWSNAIQSAEGGTKLVLHYTDLSGQGFSETKVFSIPGHIPNGLHDEMQKMNRNLSIYPNPNNGSFFVKLYNNEGEKQVIDLYSANGTLINSYISSGNIAEINNTGIPEGIYFINSRVKGIKATAKMIIQK